ncbi:MAG: GNAT family N-acetyltransferase, partial [Acidimicrobiia bacterium]|nr:GNAT family N-acetyltransferase [Acidimicrobiia bacterium]
YEGRDAVYDLSGDRDEDQADWFLEPSVYCHVLVGEVGVEAFCTFGDDAKVPGGHYSMDAVDIGIGTRPDLVGAGGGVERTAALMALADDLFGPGLRRVTIAAWNERAQKVAKAVGFAEVSRFTRDDGTEFVVLVRSAGQ